MKTVAEHNKAAWLRQLDGMQGAGVLCDQCRKNGRDVEMKYPPWEGPHDYHLSNYHLTNAGSCFVICPVCERKEQKNQWRYDSTERTVVETPKVVFANEPPLLPAPTTIEIPRRILPPVEPKKPFRIMSEIELARTAILWSLFAFEAIYAVWKHFIEPC